ncbi:MAG: inorganic phosphate transporter [bacterium]|nr:inorganic phosphate transporter [bacterium]
MTAFEIPFWVVVISAAAMGAGTLFGGWSLIKTLGAKFYRVRPVHGFGAQTMSSAVIIVATQFGGPVSTTHVVSTAIGGAGAADRAKMVRWGVFNNIVMSWVLTIPATILLGGFFYAIIDLVFG